MRQLTSDEHEWYLGFANADIGVSQQAGDAMKQIQKALGFQGGAIDGDFGPATGQKVLDFVDKYNQGLAQDKQIVLDGNTSPQELLKAIENQRGQQIAHAMGGPEPADPGRPAAALAAAAKGVPLHIDMGGRFQYDIHVDPNTGAIMPNDDGSNPLQGASGEARTKLKEFLEDRADDGRLKGMSADGDNVYVRSDSEGRIGVGPSAKEAELAGDPHYVSRYDLQHAGREVGKAASDVVKSVGEGADKLGSTLQEAITTPADKAAGLKPLETGVRNTTFLGFKIKVDSTNTGPS